MFETGFIIALRQRGRKPLPNMMTPPSSVRTGRKLGLGKQLRNSRTLILMSLPAIAFFVMFYYIPMPGAYISFVNFNYQAGIFGSEFVGLDNFAFLMRSGKLWMLSRNTILYNVAFIALGNSLQILIAILLNEVRANWFKKLSQSLMFLPYFISAVLMGLLAFNFLNYDFGFIATISRALGKEVPRFYSSPNAWPWIIIVVNLWQTTGYGSIIYFATICGIDPSIVEAAQIDGANALQRIRYILLPCLKPTAIILVLFSIGTILRGNFGLFYNLVGTANASLQPTTDIIETFVYRSLMNQFNFPAASAAGLFQSVVGFAIVMAANAIVRKIEPDYSLF